MTTRDNYIVTGKTMEEMQANLNFILQRIADRLDQLEGLRGKPTLSTEGVGVDGDITVTVDGETIHSFE